MNQALKRSKTSFKLEKMKKTSLLLGGIIVLLITSSGYALEISGGSIYTKFELSGKIKSEGTDIDMEKDLGMEDEESWGGFFEIDGKRHHLLASLSTQKFEGSKILEAPFEFRNKTYPASTRVDSKIEYNLYELQYHYDLLDIENRILGFSLASLFKVSVYEIDANIKDSSFGYDETYQETLFVPTIGFLIRTNLTKFLNLTAQASTIEYSGDSYTEYKAFLEISPIESIGLGIGYEGRKVDYAEKLDLIDIESKGAFAQLRFLYKF